MMMTYHSNIPEELKHQKNWCCYKLIKNELTGKNKKLPFNPKTGKNAKSNDPKTWLDFETCLLSCENSGEYDGLGFFFAPPYFGVDIDNIEQDIEKYEQDPTQENMLYEFIHTLQTYAEYSVSRKGIHLICKGVLPNGRRRKNNVEMYQEGRFFIMTGDTLGEYENVEDCTEQIKHLHEKYLGEVENVHSFSSVDYSQQSLDVSEIYDCIQKSKQAEKFNRLYSGDITGYNSHSEADLGLCNMLAYWCACDEYKMDTLYRTSGLYREKWDELRGEKTYGETTIEKAIKDCKKVFTKKKDDYHIYIDNMEVEHIHTFDDTGNAQRFIARHGGKVLYNYSTNKWLVYDGVVWNSKKPYAIRLLVDDVVNNLEKEYGWIQTFNPDERDKQIKELTKHIKNTRSRKSKENLLHEAQHLRGRTADEFDIDPYLFNCQNGYLDLQSGEFRNHNREKLFTLVSETEFSETQPCELWLKFLNEIFENNEELIEFVQRALGYSMCGLPLEHCMFILNGDGSNGKSVFLNVIKDVFGSYAKIVQAETLMGGNKATGPNPEIVRLMNTRLAITSETQENATLNEPLIKQLTGGDTISARGLHQEPIEFRPCFKIWMATNHKPQIIGMDRGIWRRIHLINFNYTVKKIDKILEYKLKRELSGILYWVFEGFLKYQRYGLTPPRCVQMNTNEYKKEMNTVSLFADECLEPRGDMRVKAYELYKIYKMWCKDTNSYTVTATKFTRELSKKYPKMKSNGLTVFIGFKIKYEFTQQIINNNIY